MYKVIMVPTDGSGFDREAIRVALRMAERSNAKVRLVRVLESDSFFGTTPEAHWTPMSAELGRSERTTALSELYALAAECRSGFKADITVDLHGGPVADVLQGYARRHDVDLIVMSTHGRSGISRLSLGSVTDSLIRHTTIPVLVVKSPTSYLNPQVDHAFKRIVVPLDGSTLAEQVLPRVLTWRSSKKPGSRFFRFSFRSRTRRRRSSIPTCPGGTRTSRSLRHICFASPAGSAGMA